MSDIKNIGDFENIIENGSVNINDYLSLGNLYFDSGDFNKIIDLYNQALTLKLNELDKARVFYELAEVLQILNQFDDSTAHFHKAIKTLQGLDNSWESMYINGFSLYNLFLSCMDANKLDLYAKKAIDYFLKLNNKHADNVNIYHVLSALADIYAKLGEHDMALHYYNLALKKVTDVAAKVQILSGIASIYGSNGQQDLCSKFFNNALKTANESNSSKVYYDMGVVYFNAGLFKEADKIFRIALDKKELDPFLKNNEEYKIDINWHLGVAAYELGQSKNDVVAFLIGILTLIDGKHLYYSSTNLTLGHFYSSINQNAEAIEYYNNVTNAENATDDEVKMAKKCLANMPYDA